MFWFWLNIPVATACFAAWCGIPLWMVVRHPNWGPEPGHGRHTGHSAQRPGLEPTFVLSGNPAGAATVGAGTGRQGYPDREGEPGQPANRLPLTQLAT
jgi:hypothetical protein